MVNVSVVSELFRNGMSQCVALGKRYHKLHFTLRAFFSNDPKCAPAHHQFGVASTAWLEDPSFADWVIALELVFEVEESLKQTGSDVRNALAKLNDIYFLIGTINGKIDDLLTGIERMERFATVKTRRY